MKKIILRGLLVVGCIVAVGGVGFYVWLQSMLPAKEERIAHNNAVIIASIDKQLEGINIENVKSKKGLIEQKSLDEIKEALSSNQITYEELTAYYLLNIKEYDQSENGNNAISEVNPKAIEEARKYDQEGSSLELAGIPVLVKENINTNDMPTSAGSYALKDFIPKNNAEVIDELKSNGAIILGKTNLSEMSHYMSQKNPSGYSSKKGQTTNPFNPLVLSPLGSSTGSAVAMATDLATLSLGTETAGSIVAPASVNSVVGYKPTRGNISGAGVIPITYSLDTVGVITKNVKDAYSMYNVSTDKTIEINLNKDAIKGKVVGIIKSDDKVFDEKLLKKLEEIGATAKIIEVDSSKIDTSFILKNDFEKDLNDYLQTNDAPIKSLEELVSYNKEDKEVRMRYGQSHLEGALGVKRDDEKVKQIINEANVLINKTLKDNAFDILVGKNNSSALLAATAGAPEISVPFGLLNNEPVAATFFAAVEEDAKVLELSYSFEQLTMLREIPNK